MVEQVDEEVCRKEEAMENEEPLLIPIYPCEQKGRMPTWAMLELNGELIMPKEIINKENGGSSSLSVDLNGQIELGSLRFEGNSPVMVLGTHELKGKVEKLKQPYCVMQKQDGGDCSYQVQGLVTQKLLFNQYPKTIMR